MKAKVINAYTDKHTQQVHLVGEEIELKADRAKELEEGGFIAPISEPKPKKKD